MINFNQKSYFEVQLKAATNTSYNFLNINELVAVNYNYDKYTNKHFIRKCSRQ